MSTEYVLSHWLSLARSLSLSLSLSLSHTLTHTACRDLDSRSLMVQNCSSVPIDTIQFDWPPGLCRRPPSDVYFRAHDYELLRRSKAMQRPEGSSVAAWRSGNRSVILSVAATRSSSSSSVAAALRKRRSLQIPFAAVPNELVSSNPPSAQKKGLMCQISSRR
jgi:hypothetical protein